MTWQAERHSQSLPDGHEDDSPTYEAGKEIEVSESTAQHFINKGVAEKIGDRARQAREVQKPLDKPSEEAKPVGR